MRARVPCSSANLGPGYDALALALGLGVTVRVEPARSFVVTAEGEGSDLPVGGEHLAARIARRVLGHDDVAIHVDSQIPVARGLGSSAALAVAVAAAAGSDDPLAVAASSDGHAENAAASVLGGLVAASLVDGVVVARRLPLDARLSFVVLVPDQPLPTATARAVLPGEVALGDAVHNLGRIGLLLAGLADASQLTPAAGADRLHQPARSELFPQATELLSAMVEEGALAATWSGAGPSLLGICDGLDSAARVRDAGEAAMSQAGVPGRSLVLEADLEGLVVER